MNKKQITVMLDSVVVSKIEERRSKSGRSFSASVNYLLRKQLRL